MKREYEGESIQSQSVAQLDEPVQQMNSHEAGEEMPTRRLCKKLKTYSRRKLLEGTSSTNPSKSASPAGSTPANEDRTRADNQVAAADTPFSTPANEDMTRADSQVAAVDTCFSAPANEDRTRADNQVADDDTSFFAPANEDRTRADSQVAAVDTRISTPANEDMTRADNQVAAATPFSTFDKDGVKFGNVEDFFARVNGQIKRAQSLSFCADQSSPMDDKISATQKSTPSAETLASAKADLKRLLSMPSQCMLLRENCAALSAALSVYAAAPDLSAERALAMKKLKEDLPHFFATLRRAQKDQAEYYKESAKNILLIDKLRKDQELYAVLKDCSDKLEYQISMMEAGLKDAKTKLEAIQQQQLNLARRCFQKSSAFDKFEAEYPVLKEIKKVADADIARLEESLKDLRSRIID